ncbi:MAG: class I SAM-dependent methyltransferase [Desulfurococcaceae archaeon]
MWDSELLREVFRKYKDYINQYGWSSYTLMNLNLLEPLLRELRKIKLQNMIDFGCGYKVLSCIIAEYLNINEVYGVDINEERLNVEVPCKINNIATDITKPFSHLIGKSFDLVTSFGVIEHLQDWDIFMENVIGLSHKGSLLLISAPNLGSWINRISLLMGFQPRDLEISSKRLYGVPPLYKGHTPAGHIKIATLRAMKQFIESYGFQVIRVFPLYAKDNVLANIVDSLLKPFPSLARRYVILVQYAREKPMLSSLARKVLIPQ